MYVIKREVVYDRPVHFRNVSYLTRITMFVEWALDEKRAKLFKTKQEAKAYVIRKLIKLPPSWKITKNSNTKRSK
jgi:hypothetical protein